MKHTCITMAWIFLALVSLLGDEVSGKDLPSIVPTVPGKQLAPNLKQHGVFSRKMTFINHEGVNYDYHALFWGPNESEAVSEYVEEFKRLWRGQAIKKFSNGDKDPMTSILCKLLPEECDALEVTIMNSGAARVQLSGTLVILVSADGEGACDVQVHQDAGTNAALSGQAGADVLAIAQLAGGAVCTESASGQAVLILRIHGIAEAFIGDEECIPGTISEGLGTVHGIGHGISVLGMGAVATEVECTDDEVIFTTVMVQTAHTDIQGGGIGVVGGSISQTTAPGPDDDFIEDKAIESLEDL